MPDQITIQPVQPQVVIQPVQPEVVVKGGDEIVVQQSTSNVTVRPTTTTLVVSTGAGAGGGDKNFVYQQQASSATWTIAHNLEKYCAVTVVDTALNEVLGDVIYLDRNTVQLKFSAPFSGEAFCN